MARGRSSNPSLYERLDHLRNNRKSGAVDLALEAIGLAQDWIAEEGDAKELARELAAMHPAIATVANVSRVIGSGATGDLRTRLETVRESLVQGNRRIAENLRALISPAATVITLSNSSTVREALIARGVRSVYVLESLPGGEGKQMAEALRTGFQNSTSLGATAASAGAVRLIPDSAMGNVVPEADCALVGIDTFGRHGAILHKVGTLPLALCCRYFHKPFYAAGHSFKSVDRELTGPPDPGKGPAEQIFDHTPGELLTRLITEKAE